MRDVREIGIRGVGVVIDEIRDEIREEIRDEIRDERRDEIRILNN